MFIFFPTSYCTLLFLLVFNSNVRAPYGLGLRFSGKCFCFCAVCSSVCDRGYVLQVSAFLLFSFGFDLWFRFYAKYFYYLSVWISVCDCDLDLQGGAFLLSSLELAWEFRFTGKCFFCSSVSILVCDFDFVVSIFAKF